MGLGSRFLSTVSSLHTDGRTQTDKRGYTQTKASFFVIVLYVNVAQVGLRGWRLEVPEVELLFTLLRLVHEERTLSDETHSRTSRHTHTEWEGM